jgi:uncharacterized protein (TIGR00255 family)
MIRSMTGFGEASGTFEGVHFFLELRSLNNRYFKASIRLPDEFQGLEAEIESELRRSLSRGSLTVSASCSDTSGGAAHTINKAALGAYIDQLAALPQVATGLTRIEMGPLLSLPGVLQPPANEEARHDRARKAYLGLLKQACAELDKMRVREGQMLKADLLAQRDTIVEHLKVVQERAPGVVNDFAQRLKTRVETLLKANGLAIQPVDLIREIAAYAEKSDISEEITRLGGHIDQFTQLMSKDDAKPIGRTLDFLTQEMLREANTMSSKSNDVGISRAVVEIKSAIDRIKEQAANVE